MVTAQARLAPPCFFESEYKGVAGLTPHRPLKSVCPSRSSSLVSRVTMVAWRGRSSRTDSPNAVPAPSVQMVTASYDRDQDQ